MVLICQFDASPDPWCHGRHGTLLSIAIRSNDNSARAANAQEHGGGYENSRPRRVELHFALHPAKEDQDKSNPSGAWSTIERGTINIRPGDDERYDHSNDPGTRTSDRPNTGRSYHQRRGNDCIRGTCHAGSTYDCTDWARNGAGRAGHSSRRST